MSDKIVTRFAPSPTGFLHIGGARTALFNWAYARAKGGKFLLRIEDTDRARSTTEAIDAIMAGMKWLGLEADEAPVYQSKRQARHVEIATKLLQSGHAYRSYAPDQELEKVRAEARAAGVAPRYPGRHEPLAMAKRGEYVVRFKSPIEGETVIHDEVQGDVVIKNDQLDDLVLLRSDGTPTYMLAVVVDDHDMGITHVIRGDDHLTNCARQIQIYKALGWELPVFAHIPLIHGADGAKLSKRHGALGAEQYKALGYLPEGLQNYLARLGWSHGDEEIITTEQLIEWFDLDAINKAPARFDIQKLDHVNGHYIREADDDRLIADLKELISSGEMTHEFSYDVRKIEFDRFKDALPFLKERAKTLIELLEVASYLFVSLPIPMEDKAAKSIKDAPALDILKGLADELANVPSFEKEALEASLKGFAEKRELKFGKVAQPLRAVLTGTPNSPGIYDVLVSLGQEETLRRIRDVL